MTILVRAVGVEKSYGDFKALKGIDLKVRSGEVISIIGPSGSGKSTFLRCINQLEVIDGGALWVNDELVGYRRVEDRFIRYRSHRSRDNDSLPVWYSNDSTFSRI